MLFVYGNITTKLNSKTLQVTDKVRPRRKERAALSTLKGSVTLEAAMVVPVFLFAVLFLMYFFSIISFQNALQFKMENTAREIGKLNYLIETKSEETDQNLLRTGITVSYAYGRIMDEAMRNKINKTNIIGGVAGVTLAQSDMSMDKGYMSIVADYLWKIPYYNLTFNMVQRCSFKPWTGDSIIDASNSESGTIVYITRTGKVYHTSKECTYLKRSIKKMKYGQLDLIRNLNGGRYKSCHRCVHNNPEKNTTIYITDYGECYHLSDRCSTLMRYIEEIDISQAGDRRLCTKCAQKD